VKQELEQRLSNLKKQFESGQKVLSDIELQQANLRNSLLRISGAIQVLEDVLAPQSAQQETAEVVRVA